MSVEQQASIIKENRVVPVVMCFPHERNYRQHPKAQVKQLVASLERFGQGRSIVVKEEANGSYTIVAGHGIVQAAEKLQWREIRADILPQDWTPAQISGYLLADNLLSTGASDDESILAELLQEQQDAGYDLAALGSSDEQLRQMLEALGDGYVGEGREEGDGGDDFDTTPQEGPTRTHRGELWALGEHRLLVGDCTDPKSLTRLMRDEKASITFTSPPYNAARNSSLPNKDKYLHDEDELDDACYLDLLAHFTQIALQYSIYVFVNVQSLSGNKIALIDYLYQFKDCYADTLIWDKCTAEPAMAKNVLNSQFEYVHVFSEKANRAIGTKEFRGTLSNVLSLNSRQDKNYSDIHKATFPVVFAQHFVSEFSQFGEIVFDAFLGSGTTLIACERSGRVCRGCEIDPRYADVILARYEAETNEQATLLERIEEAAHA